MSEIFKRRKSVLSTNYLTLIFALSALFLVGLACGDIDTSEEESSKSTEIPKEFVGVWNGEDDTKLRIRSDGSGDYISSGYKIENGNVEYDEKNQTIEFSLFIMSRELKIDEPPKNGKMTLNGTIFKKKDYSDESDESDSSDSDSDKSDLDPDKKELSDKQVQNLIRNTFNDFGRALKKGNLSEFYENNFSEIFKEEISQQKFAKIFQEAFDIEVEIEIGEQINADLEKGPEFSTLRGKPAFQAQGSYAKDAGFFTFTVGYVNEGGEWLLNEFQFHIK